jgi:hypothetical protein
MSRFYVTDPGDPEAPRELREYTGPYYGTIRAGDQVTYDNPSFPLPLPEPLIVTELIDFGDGPVHAILNDGEYEVSASNLRPATLTREVPECPA